MHLQSGSQGHNHVEGALFLAAALALTGCPNSATVQPEGGKTPSNTGETKTEQIEAVTTFGKMEEPQIASDGSATLTTTDSTGGKYTFTQPAVPAPAASIRSVGSSPGGTWDYTNSKGIKQFEGKYSGDITSIGAGNLNLTVEKAADPSGKMQEVTSPRNFEFKVTGETFEATIPAVEIKVPVEPAKPETPPAATATLIKTVTKAYSFSSGKDYYYDGENFATIKFYSDKTFECHYKYIRTLNEVNFTFTVEGPCLVGTYTGDPSTDGTVTLNTQKWNKFLASGISITSPELTEVFTAYKNGETSKTVAITEAALTPYTTTILVTISGDTLSDTRFTSTYTPNDNSSTTFTVEAVGDDVDSFKLYYCLGENHGDGSYSSSSSNPSGYGNFSEIISITDAAENTAIMPDLFIDKDGNGTMDRGTDVIISLGPIDLKLGHHITAVVDIEKHSINFNIEGDTSQYQNIHVNAGYDGPTVPMADGKIDVYVASFRDSGSIRFINLTTQEYVQGESWNTYDISDTIELYPDEGTIPSSITFTLYDKLEEGKKIAVQEHPISEASTDEEKRFRFVQGDGNIIFYIPIGTGSDGGFLATLASSTYSTPKECLIALTYLGLRPMIYSTEANMTRQFNGLVDNMKDVVDFLEKRMNLTVSGKDLIGL